MILKTLWVQRICSYEGQIAPECILCVDEYSYGDYPDWFDKECEKEIEKLKKEITSYKIIDIKVDDKKLTELLKINPLINGEINGFKKN